MYNDDETTWVEPSWEDEDAPEIDEADAEMDQLMRDTEDELYRSDDDD